MNINDIENMRSELLDRMVDDFNEALIAAGVAEIENEDAPKIVRAILDEIGDDEGAIGEFYFSPIDSEDDEVQIFNALITLSEEVREESLANLYEAMSYINFTIPSGAFSIDKDHRFLCFRLSVPMGIDAGREEVYELINIATANAVAIADGYAGVLMDVIDEKMSLNDVTDFLGGIADE